MMQSTKPSGGRIASLANTIDAIPKPVNADPIKTVSMRIG